MNIKNIYKILSLTVYFFSLSSFSSSIKTISETLDEEKEFLLNRPGCTGVGLAHKYVNGKTTKRPAIAVFVERKLSISEIPIEYVIPKKINGYDTDVVERTFNMIFIRNSKTIKK